MRAMVLGQVGRPLRQLDVPVAEPLPHQVRLKVVACAVCRTDLHVVDGDLTEPKLPLIPGHQIVGIIDELGSAVKEDLHVGQRAGVPWLGGTCGVCRYCRQGSENLCDEAVFTGYQVDGGFAEAVVADARFVFPLPEGLADDLQVAPLLCAGLIGYRSYRLAGAGERLGLYGFGAAAHILIQLARYQGRSVYAFTRPGDSAAQRFAEDLGAVWAGDSDRPPPEPLDAAIIFAPVGKLVVHALQAVVKGGRVICGGIHMSDIPSFPYEILWGERQIMSVANLTRRDGEELLLLAPQVPLKTQVTAYPLSQANEALSDLRQGRLSGAAVLAVREP